jgi:hypothetical protein
VSRIGILLVTLMAPMTALGQMQVVSTSPTLNAIAAPTTTGVGDLRPRREHRDGDSIDAARLGQWSGAGRGAFSFSNGNKTVTVTP